jgi:hypothetical protein
VVLAGTELGSAERMAIYFSLLLSLGACGARSSIGSEKGPDSGADADADVDGDVDTDADSDADADADSDSDPLPPTGLELRPLQVCGMPTLGQDRTLRVMVMDCVGLEFSCEVAWDEARLDLRPRMLRASERDIDCTPHPVWIDCAIPDDFVGQGKDGLFQVFAWSEKVGSFCGLEADFDCAAPPDCVQLPEAPLGECELVGLREIRYACWPEEVAANDDGVLDLFGSAGCLCPADYRHAGCYVYEDETGTRFEPLVARCGACEPEAVCTDVETRCHFYDLAEGEHPFEVGIREGTVRATLDPPSEEAMCVGEFR